MSVQPATPLSAPAVEFRFVSKCLIEEKDQDRAELVQYDGGWIAVLCDGTTRSMHSADAATIATANPVALWTEDGVSKVVARLNQRRQELIGEAHEEESDPSSFFDSAMAKFAREARQTAFQTTFVTARVMPADGRFVVEAKAVGDSALLIFDGNGELLRANPPIADRDSGFGHESSITEVLPDHFVSDDAIFRTDVYSGSHVVLCSDGFYEAFDTPGQLFQWLLDHEDALRADEKPAAIEELHVQLDRRSGDDDISFIWLCPRTPPKAEAVATTPIEGMSRADRPARSRRCRFVTALICRLHALFSRSAPSVPGENAS